MNTRLFAATLLLGATATTAYAQAPDTMRIDYVHSGNHETEMFSLDRIVFEPLPWSGNMARPVDEIRRGKYESARSRSATAKVTA